MKNLFLAFLLIGVFVYTGCGDDDEDDTRFGEVALRHDGGNVTGPFLPAGVHEFIVRFDAEELAEYDGRTLDRVEFFLGELPASISVFVFEGTDPDFPSTTIYGQDISNRVNTTGWITHRPAEVIEVNGDRDLWFSILVELEQEQRSIGCDAGPRELGGDLLLREFDDNIVSFGDVTSESVNWNIRGYLAPEAE